MQLSLENALDLFRGWRDNRSPVLLFLDNDQALVKIRGTVAEVVEDEIVVVDDAARVRLGLKQAEFHYQDRREEPDFLRQISEVAFLCCVEVCLPTEGRCFLFELMES